jgi:hypothetical protein
MVSPYRLERSALGEREAGSTGAASATGQALDPLTWGSRPATL